ncbi:MAG: SH3 domain-containing protein, partial [Tepidiformaceae bacterium]
DTPVRQPMFYVFIGMAALIGGIVIFLLFSALNNGGGTTAAGKPPVDFKVLLNSPTDGQRIATGQTTNVSVQATSTEAITQFAAFLDGQSVVSQQVTSTPPNNTYSATLTLPALTDRRNYKLFVRVTSSSGATKDSDTITIVGIEAVGDRPVSIQGKVVATTNVRSGPGDGFDLLQTLDAGQTVTIIGKTGDGNWLLIDLNGEKWVKRSAINELDSLALVPVRDATPVPQPTATSTTPPDTATPQPSVSPSPSASPTADTAVPDFLPAGAVLVDGGATLRVTIANNSNNAYAGPLEVAISGVSATQPDQAFQVSLPAAGNVSVDFALSPSVKNDTSVTVKVDPSNAVKEQRKDNNTATFSVKAQVETPVLSLTVSQKGNNVAVVVNNSGGPLAAPVATITVTLTATAGQPSTKITIALAIPKGGSSQELDVPRPGGPGGPATVEVDVNGSPLVSTQTTIT